MSNAFARHILRERDRVLYYKSTGVRKSERERTDRTVLPRAVLFSMKNTKITDIFSFFV